MTTISCDVMRGGGDAPRLTFNGQTFIECGVLRGGGILPDAKIGSAVKVINVKSWSPDQDDVEVPHGHSEKLNIEAINTAEKDLLYADGPDYDHGTHDQTTVVGTELQLATSAPSLDFENYTLDDHLHSVGQPDEWLSRIAGRGFIINDDLGDEPLNQYVRPYTSKSIATLEDAGTLESGVLKARVRFDSDQGAIGLAYAITGSGTAIRGRILTLKPGVTYCSSYLINSDTNWFGSGSTQIGFTILEDTWYWLQVRFVLWDNAGTPNLETHFKVWEQGDSEPENYIWNSNTASYATAGAVGLGLFYYVIDKEVYLDDFSVIPIPSTYFTSGAWEDEVDVSVVEHFSQAQVSWDETIPTDTTLAVKYRWRDIDAWAALIKDATIPGIVLGADMQAGSTKSDLSLRVELATTNTTITPGLSNLRVYFKPVREESLRVNIHGVDNQMVDESLVFWGRAWLTSGSGTEYVEDPDWSDLWIQTRKRWMARDLQTVTAALYYWDNLIESITFEAEAGPKYRNGHEPCEWVVPALVMASGPTICEWTALTEWYPMGHAFMWNIIDQGQAIHADYWWLVGHVKINDQPGMLITAVPALTDHPGSMLAWAFKIDDHVGQSLVQGWRFDDAPGMTMPAQRFIIDQIGSILVATEQITDHPGMFLLYLVNRDGAIFVNVIDNNTYQTLLDEGVIFS